jgi:hypothetical protein
MEGESFQFYRLFFFGFLNDFLFAEDGRVLVSIAIEGGIADNLSGLMSEFYLALLSNRALQIYDYGYLPTYEPAFNYAYPKERRGDRVNYK